MMRTLNVRRWQLNDYRLLQPLLTRIPRIPMDVRYDSIRLVALVNGGKSSGCGGIETRIIATFRCTSTYASRWVAVPFCTSPLAMVDLGTDWLGKWSYGVHRRLYHSSLSRRYGLRLHLLHISSHHNPPSAPCRSKAPT